MCENSSFQVCFCRWSSASLYVGSRISQVVKNNDRGSVEGLSLAMIFCAIAANFTYGMSICMRLYSWYVCCHRTSFTRRYLLDVECPYNEGPS